MRMLSFVFQGKFFFADNFTSVSENIARVRQLFPNSEIILSTWKVERRKEKIIYESLKNLNIKVIFNQDPGALIYQRGRYRWGTNINRMLVSSLAGIENSTRSYVVKLRTDSYFYNKNIRRILAKKIIIDRRYKRDPNFSIFDERVINCNLMARNSRSYRPFLFHPGDIMLIGRKADLINFYAVPLADKQLFKTVIIGSIFTLLKYVPEQYMWVFCIKNKTNKLVFTGNDDNSQKSKFLSENYFINNFIPLNCFQLGFNWPKYTTTYRKRGYGSLFFFEDWIALNSQYSKKNNSSSDRYTFIYNMKVKLFTFLYFLSYLPLRCKIIRFFIMNLKSRE